MDNPTVEPVSTAAIETSYSVWVIFLELPIAGK